MFWQHLHFCNICVLATFAFCQHWRFDNICVLQHLCFGNICDLKHLCFGCICLMATFAFKQHFGFSNICFLATFCFGDIGILTIVLFLQNSRFGNICVILFTMILMFIRFIMFIMFLILVMIIMFIMKVHFHLLSSVRLLFYFSCRHVCPCLFSLTLMNELTYRVIPRPRPWLCLTGKGHGRKNYSNVHFSISALQHFSFFAFQRSTWQCVILLVWLHASLHLVPCQSCAHRSLTSYQQIPHHVGSSDRESLNYGCLSNKHLFIPTLAFITHSSEAAMKRCYASWN